MKLCFPTTSPEGVNDTIYGHFASAPHFLIVDTESWEAAIIDNCDRQHPHAGCSPFLALRRESLDGIIVGGIGDDALRTMNLCGFRVFQALSASVRENAALFARHELPELEQVNSRLEESCSGQACDHRCSHDH